MDQVEFEVKYGHVGRGGRKQKGDESAAAACSFGSAMANQVRQCRCCGGQGLARGLTRLAPILGWLPNYKFSEYFHCDLITGLTVGIMVVPQGMAYATLAKVPPVVGLYSCFFSAFFYMFFGTSPHVSIGTFAVASMMVGNVRAELVPDPAPGSNGTTAVHGPVDFGYPVSPLMLTSAITFAVGLCQLLMALCRLSFLTNYISDPLVSGFTTGAAIHVLTSQLDKLIGVKIRSYNGPGMILFMWRDLVLAAKNANLWTVGISAFGLCFLSLGRDYLNPVFRRHFRIPFPLELFLVIAAIIFSMLLGLKPNYGVKIVDHVPDGMPLPSLPHLNLLPHIWLEAFTISVVCYVFVFSLGKIFAKKHKYKVDPNQELHALGLCSVLASFFPVYPFGASLSRSSLCEMTGAKTQLHALFSSALLLVVILWIGPLLEPLPMAVLACIVAVSLKPLFLQFRELAKLWRISIYDFAIWLVAFLATAFLDITYGLSIAVLFSIFTVVLKEQWPKFGQLGEAHDGIFRPLSFYTGLTEPRSAANVQIWRFEAPLHFANAPRLVEQVAELCAQMGAEASSSSKGNRTPSDDSISIKISGAEKPPHHPTPPPSSPPPAAAAEQQSQQQLSQSSPNANGRRWKWFRRQRSQGQGGAGDGTGADANNEQLLLPPPSTVGTGTNDPLLMLGESQILWTALDGIPSSTLRTQKPAWNSRSLTKTLPSPQQQQPNGGGGSASNLSDSLPSATCAVVASGVPTLILDCSAIAHIDAVGVDALQEMDKDARRLQVALKFAAFSDSLLAVFHRCHLFEQIPEACFFPSVQDALQSAGSSGRADGRI